MLKKIEDDKIEAGFFLADASDFEAALKQAKNHLKFKVFKVVYPDQVLVRFNRLAKWTS